MTVTMSERNQIAPRVSAASRVGQATAVEQSRAVAQVEAQVVVAMRYPRNVQAATLAMREACTHPRLAEKAFFRFSRGGATVSGPSIHLARELARVWGNIEYGVHEMRRDDAAGQSEMLAFAWDLQTNARNSSVFINPHVRDKKTGPERLTDMRDIYESNANAGARRVREAIFATLPTWFVEEATDLCTQTLTNGGGKPLATRVADAITAFGRLGVTQGQMEAKIGRDADHWIDQDVAQLQVIFRSLQRGEISREEEFPSERLSAAALTGEEERPARRAKPARHESQTADEPDAPAAPASANRPRSNGASGLSRLVARIPLGSREDVTAFMAWRAGRPVERMKDLSAEEVQAITTYLEGAVTDAGGDAEAAASRIWEQYRAETDSLAGDETEAPGE